jgi:hypothetical protein
MDIEMGVEMDMEMETVEKIRVLMNVFDWQSNSEFLEMRLGAYYTNGSGKADGSGFRWNTSSSGR